MASDTSAYASPNAPIAGPGGLVQILLGTVETTSTRVTGGITITHYPTTAVDSGRPDLATSVQLQQLVEDYGATYYGQRASVSNRGPARIIGGRPQAPAAFGMYSSSSMLVGLDAVLLELQNEALAENLGSDTRFVADPAKLQNSILIAPQALQASVGSGALPIWFTPVGGAAPVSIDAGYYYTSRVGDITRPALYEESTIIHYDPASPGGISDGSYSTFTFSLVAMLHETTWSFNDLIAAYCGNVYPADATLATLRFSRDDLELYIDKRRLASFKVNKYAAAAGSQEKTKHARPTIIVWAMDKSGTTSLVVYTPHGNLTKTYTFPKVPTLRGPFTISGPAITGFNADAGAYNTGFYGGLGRMEILDVGWWSDALALEDCEAAARTLDQIYGVAR